MYPLLRILLAVIATTALMLAAEAFPPLPLDQVGYERPATENVIARLAERIESGETRLAYQPDFGYLPALLKQLDVPVSSQVLVFSKTSFQATRISPRTPRAVYHGPEVYVGWVRGGDVVELMATDRQHGLVFYTLDQEQVRRPKLERRGQECLQCHVGAATLQVPGLVVRSVVTNRGGMALFPGPSYLSDHRSPLRERWGGWYVTGELGEERHMGNAFVEPGEGAERLDRTGGQRRSKLDADFNTAAYLSPHSDLISLMVLEHQTRITNLMTRVLYEERLGRVADSSLHALADALAMKDEARWVEPITGTSAFTREYSKTQAQLDLQTKLFRQRHSPLLNSSLYQALSADTRKLVAQYMAH